MTEYLTERNEMLERVKIIAYDGGAELEARGDCKGTGVGT